METSNIMLEKKDGVATITINRLQFRNALSLHTLLELGTIVEDIREDEGIMAVVLTGAGGIFSEGVEVEEIANMSPEEARHFSHIGSRVFRSLELMEKLVIAAIDGCATGGGLQLSLACDIRIAAAGAKLSLPELSLGIIPGFGGTQRLVRIIGMGRAKEFIFSCREVSSSQALEMGLVSMVVDSSHLMEEAYSLATSIVRNGRPAVKLAKAAINTGAEVDMDTALGLEEEMFAECFLKESGKNIIL